jgi:hypothetical protein
MPSHRQKERRFHRWESNRQPLKQPLHSVLGYCTLESTVNQNQALGSLDSSKIYNSNTYNLNNSNKDPELV